MRFFLLAFLTLFAFIGAQAEAAYRLKAGDSLRVEVLEDSNLNRQVLILPDGSASYLSIGSFRAAGRTVGQISTLITNALAPDFASPPNVYVSVEKIFVPPPPTPKQPVKPVTMKIFVMGEVAQPGVLELSPGSTILQALAAAGGPTKFAAKKRIELHRVSSGDNHEKIYRYNFENPRSPNSLSGATELGKGDVIVVPTRKLFE